MASTGSGLRDIRRSRKPSLFPVDAGAHVGSPISISPLAPPGTYYKARVFPPNLPLDRAAVMIPLCTESAGVLYPGLGWECALNVRSTRTAAARATSDCQAYTFGLRYGIVSRGDDREEPKNAWLVNYQKIYHKPRVNYVIYLRVIHLELKVSVTIRTRTRRRGSRPATTCAGRWRHGGPMMVMVINHPKLALGGDILNRWL